jgi:site-specific DNA recombinase
MFWLVSFKSGGINDVDHRRRVIDTSVNSVYVYDEGEKSRRIIFTFNISGLSYRLRKHIDCASSFYVRK